MDTSSVFCQVENGSLLPVRVRVSNLCEVSGDRGGVVVTGLCLSRRTVLHVLLTRTCSAWLGLCISHPKCFQFAHLPPRCTSMSLDLELLKSLLLEFEQVVLCKLHTPPPLFPRVQRTAFTATTTSVETVSK